VYDSKEPQHQNEADWNAKQPQNDRHIEPLAYYVDKNPRRRDIDVMVNVPRLAKADTSSGVGNMRFCLHDGSVIHGQPLGQSLDHRAIILGGDVTP
jgi:hypothetical protein